MKRQISSYFKNSDEKEEKKKKASKLSPDKNYSIEVIIAPSFSLKPLKSKDLNISYGVLFDKSIADMLYQRLEKEIEYDKCSQVKIFGKTFLTPRKQSAFGDQGLTYTFSGVTVPARNWTELLCSLKDIVKNVCKCDFNFVLVNRYKDGEDYMGEHRDDEKDLDSQAPIASLSFGQARDFIFKHSSSKQKIKPSEVIENVKFHLQHGSLLVMNYPTNIHWYHGLPKRSIKWCPLPRINLTFRKMRLQHE